MGEAVFFYALERGAVVEELAMILVLAMCALAGINYGALLVGRPFVGPQFFYREGAWSVYGALLGVFWFYSVHRNTEIVALLLALIGLGVVLGYQKKSEHVARTRLRRRGLESKPVIRKTVHRAE